MRFDYSEIVDRVLRRVAERGENPKHIQALLKIHKSQWSRKKTRKGNEFSYEELSAIADHYTAPPGWPFIDWELGAALERAMVALATATRRTSDPGSPASDSRHPASPSRPAKPARKASGHGR